MIQILLGIGAIIIVSFLFMAVFSIFGHRRVKTSAPTTASSPGIKNKPLKGIAADLHNEKAKSDIILRAIDDGVVLIDQDRNIVLMNDAAARITGWPVNEAANISIDLVVQLVDEKNTPYTEQHDPFRRIFTESATVRDNIANLKTRSGKIVPVSVSVSPLISQTNQVFGAVGVFRDVTEERGEEKQRAEFISTASHEMRTPVAAIEGYLALALNDKVSKIDSKARDYLQKAHDSTQHLGKLFQDLLTAAKSEDGRLSNHPVVVEMSEWLERLVEDIRFSAEKKGLFVEFVLGTVGQTVDASSQGQKVVKPLYYAHVDPDRMREVITNLFDNAVKYTDQGKITIGLTGDSSVVQIRASDTGSGIPPEDIPHLFQKFYRVDSSMTRAIGGTGLGLFICRKIVELYEGRIWVESEVGKGTTIYINLPRLTTEKAAELKAAETTQLQPLAAPGTAP